jgi:GNAT superfamily N-acetyltransferase
MEERDCVPLSQSFPDLGRDKPKDRLVRYVRDMEEGRGIALVAESEGTLCGYVTLLWESPRETLADIDAPEVRDLCVLPAFRRQGVGTRLMDAIEDEAFGRSPLCGLAVGIHPGYGAAQRLFARRDYLPDGGGARYQDRSVAEGERLPLDEDLVLCLVKEIREDHWL